MTTRDVLVVGAGNVGHALATNLVAHGHVVRVAVRDPAAAVVPAGATAVPLRGAAVGVATVVLAVPFAAVDEVVPALGLEPGAIVVDATNPFGRAVPAGHASGASVVAAAAGAGVHVVKAFNVLGAEHMSSPVLPDGHRPVLPVAGDDAAAVAAVVRLAERVGFDAVAVGGLEVAAVMEEAARYWGLLAFAGGRGRGVVLVAHQRGEV
jgi:8-hydroxy-5-deazaflavin:NADPH oxidoreductase